MSRSIVVDHLGRIEGHAGITVVLGDSRVDRVEFDVDEGIRLFEGMLRGRHFMEVPALVSRICAICSHGHAITAAEALERALGVSVPARVRTLRDLAWQGGIIESHALHVFCLALPDFVGHPSVISLAGANPEAVAVALRLKKLGNAIQEVVGGRAVHPVNYIVGGFGKLPSTEEFVRLKDALQAGLEDCDAALALLRTVVVPNFVCEPIRCAALLPEDGAFFFGRVVRLSDGTQVPVEEYRALTNERTVPHSHAKHSAYNGRPFMVGSLARLTVNGDRIRGRARAAWEALRFETPSTNIVMNNVAQFIELVYAVEHALEVVSGLLDRGFDGHPAVRCQPRAGKGTAATEVPRGTLFHHYELDEAGTVVAADVITPTAENYGSLEEQLRATVRDGTGATDDELRRRLEIVARAYDPCVSCSVHAVRRC
jgi:sulfhydrogenase subunit alpha